MPVTVRLKGRVLPEHIGLTMANVPEVDFTEEPYLPDLPNGLIAQYGVKVNCGAIEVECRLDSLTDSLVPWALNRGLRITRALIDIYSFSTGVPLSVILDRFVDPQGYEKTICFVNPHLVGLCPSLRADESKPGVPLETRATLQLVIGDIGVTLALRDLIRAISEFDASVVDCARAIDGLRRMFWPDDNDRAKGWTLLRNNLNISAAYLNFITDASKGLRHGNREYIPQSTIDETTKRSWTVMGRFLEYRLRGDKCLPENEFPVL